jgi:hypothetical protein
MTQHLCEPFSPTQTVSTLISPQAFRESLEHGSSFKALNVPFQMLKESCPIFCFSVMDSWMANPEYFQGN